MDRVGIFREFVDMDQVGIFNKEARGCLSLNGPGNSMREERG